MSSDLENAQNKLEKVSKDTAEFLARITDASEKVGKKNSSVLFGTVGGILGALVGIVGAPVLGISIFILSTFLTSLGVVGGNLVYRGRDGIALERMIYNNRLASDEVLRRIKCLPQNAPDSVQQDLWDNYIALNGAYKNQSVVFLSPPKKKNKGLMSPGNDGAA